MRHSTWIKAALLALPMLFAAPALAEDAKADAVVDDGSDNFTIGLGGAYANSYEGSNSYVPVPAGLVRGRVSGFNFYSRATELYLDLIREPANSSIDFEAGPTVNFRFDRNSHIHDARVRALGKIDTAIEVGGFAGITKNDVFDGYDFLTFRLDVTHDVAGDHHSTIIAPNIEYGTPLSLTTFVGLALSADHVGNKFADTYFAVTPLGSAASGLPVYNTNGGWKDVRGTFLVTQSLSGDLRHGWALFGVASYSRLLGDFKRSPIVSIAGDPDQLFVGGGVTFTF